MYTTEFRVNGGLVAVLHVHNAGPAQLPADAEPVSHIYEYEYYEPEVGINSKLPGAHIKGTIICQRAAGLPGITQQILANVQKRIAAGSKSTQPK